MTKNAYGVEAELDLSALNEWLWQDYEPVELLMAISKRAAETVLLAIADNAYISLCSREEYCAISVSLGSELGDLSISFAELMADWVAQEGPDEEARAPIIAALEDALAKAKSLA